MLFVFFFILSLLNCGGYWSLLWNPGQIHRDNDILMWGEILNLLMAHAALFWFAWRWKQGRVALGVRAFFLNNWAIIGVLAVNACFIVVEWKKLLIGVDEYDQALRANWKAPLFAAVQQHQQPLTYSIDRFIESLFGINDIIVRLPFAFAAWLSTLFLYLVLEKLGVRKNLAAIVALAFFCSYHMNRFAHEGRPQAFAFLTLLAFFTYFINRRHAEEKGIIQSRARQVDFFFVIYFFLISIGLQPLLFLGIFYLVVAVVSKNWKTLFRSDLIPVFLALFFAIFNSNLVNIYASPRITKALWSSFLRFFHSNSVVRNLFFTFFSPPTWVLLVLIALLFSLLYRQTSKLRKNFFWIFFLSAMLFQPLFFVIFKIFISYSFAIRYCIISIIPLWLSLGYLLETLLSHHSPNGWPWLVVVLALASASILEPREATDRDIIERQDVRALQKDFQQQLGSGDWVVSISVYQYNYDDAFEQVLYLDRIHSQPSSFETMLSILDYDIALAEGRRPKRLLFFFYAAPEVLSGFGDRLSQVSNVTLFAAEHGYLAYEIHFDKEPLLDQPFIQTLDKYYMSMNQEIQFQIPLLKLSNAILTGNRSDWTRYRNEARKIVPLRLKEVYLPLDEMIAKGIL